MSPKLTAASFHFDLSPESAACMRENLKGRQLVCASGFFRGGGGGGGTDLRLVREQPYSVVYHDY
jgi:hypothetical protein